jgi:hypothetical protein
VQQQKEKQQTKTKQTYIQDVPLDGVFLVGSLIFLLSPFCAKLLPLFKVEGPVKGGKGVSQCAAVADNKLATAASACTSIATQCQPFQ